MELEGQLVRKPWFTTPCCPSNISRIWANIGEYIYSQNKNDILIHQYIGNATQIFLANGGYPVNIIMISQMPWEGKIKLKIKVTKPKEFTIQLRIPSWTNNPQILVNGELQKLVYTKSIAKISGSGLSPQKAKFYPLTREWTDQTIIDVILPMRVTIHRAHPKVKANRKKIAISHGPIVYCIESIDNPSIPISKAKIDLSEKIRREYDNGLLRGVIKLQAKDKQGQLLIAIPYYAWANRGESAVKIWINE